MSDLESKRNSPEPEDILYTSNAMDPSQLPISKELWRIGLEQARERLQAGDDQEAAYLFKYLDKASLSFRARIDLSRCELLTSLVGANDRAGGPISESIYALQEIIYIRTKLGASNPNQLSYDYLALSEKYMRAEDYENAINSFESALIHSEQDETGNFLHVQLAISLGLAQAQYRIGDFESSIQTTRNVIAKFQEEPNYQDVVLNQRLFLAHTLDLSGKPIDAERVTREVVRYTDELFSNDSEKRGYYLYEKAKMLLNNFKLSEASSTLDEVEALIPSEPSVLRAKMLVSLAELLSYNGEFEQAKAKLYKSLDVYKKLSEGEQLAELFSVHMYLGGVHCHTGDLEQARFHLQAAIESNNTDNKAGVFMSSAGIKQLEAAIELAGESPNYEKAEKLLKEALDVTREHSIGHQQLLSTAYVLCNLGECQLRQGQLYMNSDLCEVAQGNFLQAWGIIEKRGRTSHPIAATTLGNLASTYEVLGDSKNADIYKIRAEVTFAELKGLSGESFFFGIDNSPEF